MVVNLTPHHPCGGGGVGVAHAGYARVVMAQRSQSVPPYGAEHTLHVAPDHLLRHVHAQLVLFTVDVEPYQALPPVEDTEVAWPLQWVVAEHARHIGTAPVVL